MINMTNIWQERITVRRREKTFTMYEQEHEIIGSQLSKDQENYLENYEPNNLQDDESTTAKRNEENHNKHVIASGTLQINCLCYTFATLLTQLFELTQIRMMIFKKWRNRWLEV